MPQHACGTIRNVKKKYISLSFFLCCAFIPVSANAATADEIRTQIEYFVGQIALLQQKLASLGKCADDVEFAKRERATNSTYHTDYCGQEIAMLLECPYNRSYKIGLGPCESKILGERGWISPGTATVTPTCPNFYRSLSRGSRGSDVTELQRFLIAQNLLAADSATGFFGELTESAVRRWQAANGVVASGDVATTGFGAVGSRTRAAIAQRCHTDTSTSVHPVDLGKFEITLPLHWKYVPLQGIDSFVGRLEGDGITLTFDYGAYGGIPSVQERVKGPQSYTISRETLSTGYYTAEVMIPKVPGVGEIGTYIFIRDGCNHSGICKAGGPDGELGLRVSGVDVPPGDQETVLKIVRSIHIKE